MSEIKQEFTVEITYNGERITVSKEVADYLEACKRDAHRQYKQSLRNQSPIKFDEDSIEELMATPSVCFENDVIFKLEKEKLMEHIAILKEPQKRRLLAYYFEGLTYAEIATREGVDHRAVMRSVESAVKSLKKYF